MDILKVQDLALKAARLQSLEASIREVIETPEKSFDIEIVLRSGRDFVVSSQSTLVVELLRIKLAKLIAAREKLQDEIRSA